MGGMELQLWTRLAPRASRQQMSVASLARNRPQVPVHTLVCKHMAWYNWGNSLRKQSNDLNLRISAAGRKPPDSQGYLQDAKARLIGACRRCPLVKEQVCMS